jgi:hypothetical protein
MMVESGGIYTCLLRYVYFLVFNSYQVQDKMEISIWKELRRIIAKQYFFFKFNIFVKKFL